WIPFELSDDSDVAIRVYDSRGMLVRRIDVGYREEGYYTRRADAAYWDGRNEFGERVASGVYIYEVRAGSYRGMRRMVILK
ncbi:MAG: FlgD immunoglobulin-like domain containing protein, partial [Candidatus Poribacteria bacterium]